MLITANQNEGQRLRHYCVYREAVNARIVTYAQLVEKLTKIGVDEREVNVRNKLLRGKFTAAFLLQCLAAVEAQQFRLD